MRQSHIIPSVIMHFISSFTLDLITHCVIPICTGKVREVKPLTVIVSLIFIARYAFTTLR